MSDLLPTLEPWLPVAVVAGAGLAIVLLTTWTYRTAEIGKGGKRWGVLLFLRLTALAIACLVLLRPSWDYKEVQKLPASIIVLIDGTKSMGVKDEDPNQTRWETAVRDWDSISSLLPVLERDHQVHVEVYQFDSTLRPFKPAEPPSGDRTAVMRALAKAYDDRDRGSILLGIVILSDGRDNVGKPSSEELIAKLARAPCPVHAIALGHVGGSELQPDVIAQTIEAPQTARIKDRMTVRGTIQTHRFVDQEIEVWLLIDGQPVDQADDPSKKVRVIAKPQLATQIIPIEMPAAKLPDQPGERKVSLWCKPIKGELTETNNEVSTYVTLIKEGLSVLYIDKLRAWEPKYLQSVLKGDDRISLYAAVPPSQDNTEDAKQWRKKIHDDIDKNAYDVIILGDVPASRFAPATPEGRAVLELIRQKVEAGTGFLMIGGHDSFGDGNWDQTMLAPLFAVDLSRKGQLEGPAGNQRDIQFTPTDAGLRHFALLLESDPQRNKTWWDRLPKLNGGNRLGRKANAEVLAGTTDGDVLLAVQQYAKGRTAALAVDTTWIWTRGGQPHNPADAGKEGALSECREAHLRFWRQLILWLARQEEIGKSVRIELAHRRLSAGKEQQITVQAREITPGGGRDTQKPIKGAEFTVTVLKADKTQDSVQVRSDGGEEGKSQGTFWKTDEPGEYEVVVSAKNQGVDLGTAKARFVAYRDDSELLNRTANHVLLEQIAKATGGSFRLHSGLREVLDETKPETKTELTQVYKLPNWDESNLPLQMTLFLLFVCLICAEWLLRRLWGTV